MNIVLEKWFDAAKYEKTNCYYLFPRKVRSDHCVRSEACVRNEDCLRSENCVRSEVCVRSEDCVRCGDRVWRVCVFPSTNAPKYVCTKCLYMPIKQLTEFVKAKYFKKSVQKHICMTIPCGFVTSCPLASLYTLL